MSETIIESGFSHLRLPTRLNQLIEKSGFTIPTPIQAQAIPVALTGRDLLGIAQTGTGKTLAFGLPMLSNLMQSKGMGLVMVPTRELAIQVDDTIRKLAAPLNIKTAVLIGGAPIHKQVGLLRGGARILICTPGRLMDHIKQGSVRLDTVCVAVLDEADRMLDMGFAPDIRRILERVPKDRQTMLFSATMPSTIEALTHEYMRSPERIEIARAGTANELVEQSLMIVPHEQKPDTLRDLLKQADGTILVFSRTRHGARKTARMVRDFGYHAAELHSDRTLAQRREALEGFKSGRYQVLVATDIAARGIDVKRIELVVNYDVPENPEDYVHRIGRTGRAGETGRAVTVATPEQASLVWDVERLLGNDIPLDPTSPSPFEHFSERMHRGAHGRGPQVPKARRSFGKSGAKPQRGGPARPMARRTENAR